ncbi:MAG: glycosyltransferase family 39 protein [Bacteroidota bacterium]
MTVTRNIRTPELLLFAGLAIVAFLPFLGAAPLFDWDEINFAESAREMIASGNYFQVQINYEPFWEKPPLFFWMQVISMKLFGINEFAARFPNAIIGILTICSLYSFGTRMRHNVFGMLVAGFYFASILPHLYFKSGIIDPTFNFFIFLGVAQLILYESRELGRIDAWTVKWAPWKAGLWIGLATLTKGPVALLVTGLIYFVYKAAWGRLKGIPWGAILRFVGVFLLVIVSWFGSIVLLTEDGFEMVRKFIVYQVELFSQDVAGHAQPFYYHFLVYIVGCFPLAAFAFRGMTLKFAPSKDLVLKRFMVVWFWVVLILFSIVKTKIVHYSSLLYYPGAFLAAMYFYELIRKRAKMQWDNWALYGLGMLVFGIGVCLVNIIAANPVWLDGIVKGSFGKAALASDVEWSGIEFVPAIVFLIVVCVNLWHLIQKKYIRFMLVAVCVMPLYINGLNKMVLPRIADYSQNAAIEFLKEKADEDVYIMVEGYKSYAQYFYGKVKPWSRSDIPKDKRGDWMARRKVDKPVYLVTRIDKATEQFEREWFPKFKRLYTKGGFVFYLREMPDQK